MNNRETLVTDDHMLAVYDLENFAQIAKQLNGEGIFSLMNEIQILTVTSLLPLDPLIIKNIGDANLIIMDKDGIDEKISALCDLKESIERLLRSKGYSNRASFSCHYGEITVGMLGTEPFAGLDAFGDEINMVFSLNGRPFRGRFTISPRLFRKLSPAARKRFHKFTPQIVYTAE